MAERLATPPFETDTERLLSQLEATPRISQALTLAGELHDGQTYEDEPYINHVVRTALRVQAKVSELADGSIPDENLYEDLIVAALLHDSVEDTAISIEEIADCFGLYAAQIVEDVTYTEEDSTAGIDKVAKFRRHAASKLVKWADSSTNLEKCEFEWQVDLISPEKYVRRRLGYSQNVEALEREMPSLEELIEEKTDFLALCEQATVDGHDSLFPLDRTRWFGRHIVDHAVDTAHF